MQIPQITKKTKTTEDPQTTRPHPKQFNIFYNILHFYQQGKGPGLSKIFSFS